MQNLIMIRKRNKQSLPAPTNTELSILTVLWQLGPGTVREILKRFNQDREAEAGYTTILKMLQVMYEKGLVDRDNSQRPQVYRAVLREEETQRQLVTDLLEKAFGGSAKKLVMQALAAKETSEKELAQIERLLDRVEGGTK
jgi:BlaI family transcriptional regulator, penicillinase repressor